MAQRPTNVPKFGNFDANEEIPYTMVFDQARANKAAPGPGKLINPNDPSENPAAFGIKHDTPPVPPPARDNKPNYNAGEQVVDRKGRNNGREPYVPARIPPRTPDRVPERAAVPKFGDWDENDPSAGEGFTMIFTKAKVERDAGGPAHIPAFRNDPAPIPQKETKQPQSGSAEKQPSCWSRCFGS